MTNYLEVKNLSKSFDSFQLHNINFTLPKGYIMGLIGPNGSGKTTTIKLILNMLGRNSGEIKIMGLDNITDEQKAKAELGVVFDTNYFSDDWQVTQVEKSISVFYPNWNSERFAEMLRKFHIAPTKKVKELSKGMQMKLMLACAFSYDAKLLILDEPTSGLDPLMQHEFFRILHERNARGTTIFFSSHVLSEIQRNCSRAAIIREGHIIACDSVETLAQTNTKQITVHGRVSLDGLNGIHNLHKADDSCSFLYSGNVRLLLQRLSEEEITDLSVTEPDLEEIFLHFYES